MPRLDHIVEYLFSHPGTELVLETNSTGEYRREGAPQVPVFRQTLRTGQILLLFADLVPEPQSQGLLAGEPVEFTYRSSRGPLKVHMHMAGADIVARVRVAGPLPVASTPTPPPAPPGLAQLITELTARGASHLYLAPGQPPFVRVEGKLVAVVEAGPVTEMAIRGALVNVAPAAVRELVKAQPCFEFTAVAPEHVLHVRAQDSRAGLSVVVQQRPRRLPSLGELGLVDAAPLVRTPGLTLVAAADGGAALALAAMAQSALDERPVVLYTVEPAIDTVLSEGRGVLRQLEVGTHVASAVEALQSLHWLGPDVVVVPAVDDPAVLAEAVALADAGHVVLGGLWARTATEAAEKASSLLSGQRARQARLAAALRGVLAGVKVGGAKGRWVWEALEPSAAVAEAVRDQRSPGRDLVRRPLELALAELVQSGWLPVEEGSRLAPDRVTFEGFLGRSGIRAA